MVTEGIESAEPARVSFEQDCPSPTGGPRRGNLNRVSLTAWLQDGELHHAGGLAPTVRREVVLDPEHPAGQANICDSVNSTVDAALEQLRDLQRSRSLAKSISRGLSRLNSIKQSVSAAVGGVSRSNSIGDVLELEAASSSPSTSPSTPTSSSKGGALSGISKALRHGPTKVSSMPVLPYDGVGSGAAEGEGADSGSPFERSHSTWLGTTADGASTTCSSSSSAIGGSTNLQVAAAVAPAGFGSDGNTISRSSSMGSFVGTPQQATFSSSSSSSRFKRSDSISSTSALPGIASDSPLNRLDSLMAGYRSSANTTAVSRPQSSRLNVAVSQGDQTSDSSSPSAATGSPKLFKRSFTFSAAAAAGSSAPASPKAAGLVLSLDTSASSASPGGELPASPSGGRSPLARARQALFSRSGERIQPLTGTTSTAAAEVAVSSPAAGRVMKQSGSKKIWDESMAQDVCNSSSSSGGGGSSSKGSGGANQAWQEDSDAAIPGNSQTQQQQQQAPGRLMHSATSGNGRSGSALTKQQHRPPSKNVSFLVPGAINDDDEGLADNSNLEAEAGMML